MFPPFWDPTGQLKDAYNYTFKLLVDFLSTTLSLDGLGVAQWLISNVLGLMPLLSFVVLLFVLPGAIVIRKYRLSGALAGIVLVFSTTLSGAWFFIINTMRGASGDLSRAFATIDSAHPTDQVLNLPSMPTTIPILDGVLYFGLFSFTALFMFLFMDQAVINVFIEAFGLALIAMYGLGPRTRRLFSIIVSIGLSTLLLGQPLVILILKAGNAIGNALPAGNVQLTGFITSASMSFALLVYVALPFALYQGVHTVMGGVNAQVRNIVRSRIENKHKVDASISGKVTTASTNRAQSTTGTRYASAMASEAKRMASSNVSNALLGIAKKGVIAGSNIHPGVKAALIGGSIIVRATGNTSTKKREKVNTLDAYRG